MDSLPGLPGVPGSPLSPELKKVETHLLTSVDDCVFLPSLLTALLQSTSNSTLSFNDVSRKKFLGHRNVSIDFKL